MKIKNSKLFLHFILLFYILIFAFYILPQAVDAATLYLTPSEGQYREGDAFVVELWVDTEKETINTVRADLVFSPEVLEIEDFSQGESVLTFFARKPAFDNNKGQISFTGGTPGGYKGKGLLLKIIFRVRETDIKASSEALQTKIEFLLSSQVLLNDGLGTQAKLTVLPVSFTILPQGDLLPKDEWKTLLAEDTTEPEPFEIIITRDSSVFDGKYFIVFSAIDLGSGIDYYEIQEGEGDWKRGDSPYLLENQELKSIIKVKAVDKAGNERIIEKKPEEGKFPYRFIILFAVVVALAFWWIIRKTLKSKP